MGTPASLGLVRPTVSKASQGSQSYIAYIIGMAIAVFILAEAIVGVTAC